MAMFSASELACTAPLARLSIRAPWWGTDPRRMPLPLAAGNTRRSVAGWPLLLWSCWSLALLFPSNSQCLYHDLILSRKLWVYILWIFRWRMVIKSVCWAFIFTLGTVLFLSSWHVLEQKQVQSTNALWIKGNPHFFVRWVLDIGK